jgi:hypothetical protein
MFRALLRLSTRILAVARPLLILLTARLEILLLRWSVLAGDASRRLRAAARVE